jgi:hypothetical protein
MAQQFQSNLIGEMVNQKNLFLKVYDLAAIDPQIGMWLINSTGNIEVSVLKQLGAKQNIKALLYIDFTEFYRNEGSLMKDEKTGFERTTTKNAAGETINTDTKVKYQEFSQKNSVSLTLSYKLVSVENGETLLSDRVSQSFSDEIKYATYSGSKENLYPANNQNGNFSINVGNYRSLQTLLKASKSISSVEKLTDRVYGSVSQKIAVNINNFNPEK